MDTAVMIILLQSVCVRRMYGTYKRIPCIFFYRRNHGQSIGLVLNLPI